MIHYVIRGTKSIEEYNEVYAAMADRSQKHFEIHRRACEKWTHGEPVKVWTDINGMMCIEYADGQWWHYNHRGEWW